MSPEAQRIAIGMALGARWCQSPDGNLYFKFPTGTQGWVQCEGPLPDCSNPRWICVSDYCADLNAMHEAENMALGEWGDYSSLWHKYETELKAICGLRNHWMSATAAQRAEAFLKTLNLWDETK